jgi:serine/threonine protein kinase
MAYRLHILYHFIGSYIYHLFFYSRRQAFMPEKAMLDIFHKIALAVSVLHAQSLVHRDIKVRNVCIYIYIDIS